MMKGQTVLPLIFALTSLAPAGKSQASTWARTYGGTDLDWPMNNGASVQQTADGGYIVWGYTNSFGSADYPEWALKLDAVGNIVWENQYPQAINAAGRYFNSI